MRGVDDGEGVEGRYFSVQLTGLAAGVRREKDTTDRGRGSVTHSSLSVSMSDNHPNNLSHSLSTLSFTSTPKHYQLPRRGILFSHLRPNPFVRYHISCSRHPLSRLLCHPQPLVHLYCTLYLFRASPTVCSGRRFQCRHFRGTFVALFMSILVPVHVALPIPLPLVPRPV
jgi:hypothetical protein